MNADLFWTLLRALGVGAGALALGWPLAGALLGLRGRRRTLAWALLLAPALTPAILVGYVWSRAGLAGTAGSEALYALLLLLKFTPLATAALALIHPPMTAAALHCFRLAGAHDPLREWGFRMHAIGRGPALALTLIFLLAFMEFELAALFGARSWTVALFDAHAGGLSWRESLRLAAVPAGIEAAALVAFWAGLRGTATALEPQSSPAESRLPRAALAYLLGAALLVTVLPLLRLVVQAAPGVAALAETFALGTDLAASICFALGASAVAWLLARPLAGTLSRAALSLPGLLGPLVLSLVALAAFQLPALRLAYDSPLPLALTLTLLLLPLAVLLRWILDAARPGAALFLAARAGHGELLWQLDGRRRFAAWALLFGWAFFDFTAASTLAPLGFSPVFVRLHNLIHYGQTAVLSAMIVAAFATPVAVLLLAAPLARFSSRQHVR